MGCTVLYGTVRKNASSRTEKQKNKMATHKYLKQGPLQEQIGTKMK